MADKVVETESVRELEIAPSVVLNSQKFDAIIQFAQQAEKMGRALDTMRNFVLGRAFPGDWVRFGDKLELSGPAAERVISSLAMMGVPVSFTGWKYWKDTGTDKNGDWYTWWYQADVDIAGLHVEGVQGRAGSRDKFFGYEYGAFKDLADVKEADVRMAARRGVIKEGIKMAMGLRSVPFEHAAKLGLDPSKIKEVEFGNKKDGTTASGVADEFVAKVMKVIIKRDQPDTVKDGKVTKKGYKIMSVFFNNNVTAETFDTKVAEKAKSLIGVEAFARTTAAKDAKYAPTLQEIRTATDDDKKQPAAPPTGADAPGDAQE